MVKQEILQSLVLFSRFSDKMHAKLAEKAIITNVKVGEVIFNEGDEAIKLYSVMEGKISLEIEQAPGTMVRIKDIMPGRSFGISSLVDDREKRCVSAARAVTDCKLVVWKAEDLNSLFQEDPALGFLFMKAVARVLKGRLQVTNAQLAQVA